jgi:hypothetical protein
MCRRVGGPTLLGDLVAVDIQTPRHQQREVNSTKVEVKSRDVVYDVVV